MSFFVRHQIAGVLVLGVSAGTVLTPVVTHAEIAEFILDRDLSIVEITSTQSIGLFPPIGETVDATNPDPVNDDSFQARYDGALSVDLSGGELEFLSGSSIMARDLDLYTPGANPDVTTAQPAAYAVDYVSPFGSISVLQIAIRGLRFDLVTTADGDLQLFLAAGVADLNDGDPPTSQLTGFLPEVRTALNTASEAATLETAGLVQTLRVPLVFGFELDEDASPSGVPPIQVEVNFEGELVATRIIPEPAAGLILFGTILGLGTRRPSVF